MTGTSFAIVGAILAVLLTAWNGYIAIANARDKEQQSAAKKNADAEAATAQRQLATAQRQLATAQDKLVTAQNELKALQEEQRLQIATSRPIQKLAVTLNYRPGPGNRVSRSGVFALLISREGIPKILAGWAGRYPQDFPPVLANLEGAYSISSGGGGAEWMEVKPKLLQLPSIRDLLDSVVGIAITNGLFADLASIDIVADDYLVASSKFARVPNITFALKGTDKYMMFLGQPPLGMSWVGQLPDPNLPDNILPFPVQVEAQWRRVKDGKVPDVISPIDESGTSAVDTTAGTGIDAGADAASGSADANPK
jgi:type II secretory pathway pseudopilin PulG